MSRANHPGPPPLRVLALAAEPASTITEIRISAPLAPLVPAGRLVLTLRAWHECRLADLQACDLLIAQRPITARELRLVRTARQGGAAVVVEIDDLLTQPAPHLLIGAYLERQAPWIEQALAAADWVSVSTERLGAALNLKPAQQRVTPNYAFAQARRAPAAALPPQDGAAMATVLLAASEAVAAGPAFEGLRRLQQERGKRVRVLAVGPAAASAAAAGLEVTAQPVMPRARFLEFAGALPNALAMIPLDDSAFSAAKSAIKWFDFAAVGLPTLMADRPPYSDVVEQGQTGWLVADDPAAWHAALAAAIDDPALRARVADRAEQAVRERHTMERCTAAWAALLDEVATGLAQGRFRPGSLPLHRRLLFAWHDLGARLRTLNRERLARRAALRPRDR
jgi:hypothetical protein